MTQLTLVKKTHNSAELCLELDQMIEKQIGTNVWEALDILTKLDLRIAMFKAYGMGYDEARYLISQGID